MKTSRSIGLISLLCISIFISCSQNDIQTSVQLEEREGLAYEANQENPFTGEVITTDKDGKIIKEENFKDGLLHGAVTTYHSISKEDTLLDPNSPVKEMSGQYTNGKKNGLWTYWAKNSQKIVELTYQDDKFNGKWTSWYINGQKKKEGVYDNGKQIGLWNFWTQDGKQLEVIKDIDGNTYPIIQIGDQVWMAANLQVTHYRNGDPISNVPSDSLWETMDAGAFCYYDNNSENALIHGNLYNWYVINDSRGIAPEGWHIASDEEWMKLEMLLGMEEKKANEMKWRGTDDEGGKLKEEGTKNWNSPNTKATNESGFTALASGCRTYNSRFSDIGSNAYIWTSSENEEDFALARILYFNSSEICRHAYDKTFGFSIRCIRD